MRAVVVAVLAGSCVAPSSVTCEDGRVCPAGTTCVSIEDRGNTIGLCAAPAQLTACDGVAPLGACLLPGDATPTGACHDGVCVPGGCGNGLLDTGEVCDDGNSAIGDGCSDGCLSNEMCGNGIVDPVNSEICDDGNLLRHDGCDGACQPEQAHWTQLSLGSPPGRVRTAMAFDIARSRAVLFGGEGDLATLDDTWEWNGGSWQQVGALISPTARADHAMAYDSATGHVVLFGGASPTDIRFNDLWEWNGVTWTLDDPENTTPSTRALAAMTYDTRRHRLYVFGGVHRDAIAGDQSLADLWMWDGQAWTQIPPTAMPAQPPARRGAGLAYDPHRDKLVLVGGTADGGAFLKDTWEYDVANGWVAAGPLHVPPARTAFALTYAANVGEVVLAGGDVDANVENQNALSDTWAYDGSDWSQLPDLAAPREQMALASDPARDELVIFGGTDGKLVSPPSGAQHLNRSSDTFVLVASSASGSPVFSWTRVSPLQLQTRASAVGYDLARHRAVLFGGVDSGAGISTSELVDGAWSTPVLVTQPPARARASGAYDEHEEQLVIFGGTDVIDGTDTMSVLGDTWTYLPATSAWIPSGTGPPAREQAAMAYDVAHQEIVLFGGLGASGNELDDTWVYKAGAWQPLAVTTRPPARHGHALGYDRTHGHVVLFGGAKAQGDTWTLDLDQGTWVPMTPATSPSPRGFAAFGWSPDRRRLTLFGGIEGVSVKQDTWEWDEDHDTWVELLIQSPPGRYDAMMFASDDGGLVVVGGTDDPAGVTGTAASRVDGWRLRYDNAQPDSCHTCGDEDCRALCTPMCLPGDDCAADQPTPSCGDHVCSNYESCDLCPTDCACLMICGDGRCVAGEDATTCPGDCP